MYIDVEEKACERLCVGVWWGGGRTRMYVSIHILCMHVCLLAWLVSGINDIDIHVYMYVYIYIYTCICIYM